MNWKVLGIIWAVLVIIGHLLDKVLKTEEDNIFATIAVCVSLLLTAYKFYSDSKLKNKN